MIAFQPFPTSFYQSNFKILRVITGGAQDITASLLYKIAELGCKVFFLKDNQYQFHQLSSYFFKRAFSPLLTSLLDGKIINFSMNCPYQPKPFLKDDTSELETLKARYGHLFETMLQQKSTCSAFPSISQLKCLSLTQEVCFGASVDFAARFLKEKPSDWQNTIERISSLFVNSSTNEGQLIQIISMALLSDETIQAHLTDTVINEARDTVEEEYTEKKIAMPKDLLLRKNLKTILTSEVFRRINSCISHFYTMDLKIICIIDLTKQAAQEKVLTHFNSIPTGVYLLECAYRDDASSGHAMTYIKESNEKAYLFSPGEATFLFTSHSELLSTLSLSRYESIKIARCKKKSVIVDEPTLFKKRILKSLKYADK